MAYANLGSSTDDSKLSGSKQASPSFCKLALDSPSSPLRMKKLTSNISLFNDRTKFQKEIKFVSTPNLNQAIAVPLQVSV